MTYEFTVADVIPATPRAIYEAWLDSAGHTAMTGGEATASAETGAAFTAWDGYIWGVNLALDPFTRIVQSWRTTNFSESDPDSQIEVLLQPAAEGTRVELRHTNVPEDYRGYEDGGWQTNYFEPMKEYFAGKGTGAE